MKIIIIISTERSGTNFFCDFIGKAFTNVNSNFELFPKQNEKNNNTVHLSYKSAKYLIKVYNIDYNIKHENVMMEITKHMKNMKKTDIIKKICEVPGFNIFSFKIFQNQVTEEELDEIIKMSSFCIFLKRNPVDRYVSFIKAIESGHWDKVNNSDQKIIFDIERYEWETGITTKFINNATNICKKNKIQIANIYYETFFELSLREMQDYLHYKIFLKKFWDSDIDLINTSQIILNFTRQDNETDISKKIINYDEVKDFIAKENEKYCNTI